MSRQDFLHVLQQELDRIDAALVSKRFERVIEGYAGPRAVIQGKEYLIFNSNDYLGLRHHRRLKEAEQQASERFGAGPGAVRFISGSLKVYQELEQAIAAFHGRRSAMVFSSAFAANVGVLMGLIKGQSRDSVVGSNTLVISDELNHRSIIEGIRVAGLESDQKAIFPHLQPQAVEQLLEENKGKFDRVLVVTDGVFSMLGEFQDLKTLREVVDQYDGDYPEGVWLVVDDAHGVAAAGNSGRGTEEVTGVKADILIGTFGKGFGADGGYVAADQTVIDYLRESAATYIYSNSISPATAAAALAAVKLVESDEGRQLLDTLQQRTDELKEMLVNSGFTMATDSHHPIQPLLLGDSNKTRTLVEELFKTGIMVTPINYPVVPKGRDEIRIQINASHTKTDIARLIDGIKALSIRS